MKIIVGGGIWRDFWQGEVGGSFYISPECIEFEIKIPKLMPKYESAAQNY